MARSTEAPLGTCNTPEPNLGALFLMPTQQRNPHPAPEIAHSGLGSPRDRERGEGATAHMCTTTSQTRRAGLRGETP